MIDPRSFATAVITLMSTGCCGQLPPRVVSDPSISVLEQVRDCQAEIVQYLRCDGLTGPSAMRAGAYNTRSLLIRPDLVGASDWATLKPRLRECYCPSSPRGVALGPYKSAWKDFQAWRNATAQAAYPEGSPTEITVEQLRCSTRATVFPIVRRVEFKAKCQVKYGYLGEAKSEQVPPRFTRHLNELMARQCKPPGWDFDVADSWSPPKGSSIGSGGSSLVWASATPGPYSPLSSR